MSILKFARGFGASLAIDALYRGASKIYHMVADGKGDLTQKIEQYLQEVAKEHGLKKPLDEDIGNIFDDLKGDASYLRGTTSDIKNKIKENEESLLEATLYATTQKAYNLMAKMLGYPISDYQIQKKGVANYLFDSVIGYLGPIGNLYSRFQKFLGFETDLDDKIKRMISRKTADFIINKVRDNKLEDIIGISKKVVKESIKDYVRKSIINYIDRVITKNPIYGSDLRDSYTNKEFGYALT